MIHIRGLQICLIVRIFLSGIPFVQMFVLQQLVAAVLHGCLWNQCAVSLFCGAFHFTAAVSRKSFGCSSLEKSLHTCFLLTDVRHNPEGFPFIFLYFPHFTQFIVYCAIACDTTPLIAEKGSCFLMFPAGFFIHLCFAIIKICPNFCKLLHTYWSLYSSNCNPCQCLPDIIIHL